MWSGEGISARERHIFSSKSHFTMARIALAVNILEVWVGLVLARARGVTHGLVRGRTVGWSDRTRWIWNRGDRGRWP